MATRVMPVTLTQVVIVSVLVSLGAILTPLIISGIALSNQNNGLVTPTLQLTNTNPRIYYVGATRQHKTISEVFALLYGLNIPNVTIYVDGGIYNESVVMSGNSVHIVGDNRTLVGTTYINGHPLATSPQITYLVQSVYPALGASFGTAGSVSAMGIRVTGDACSGSFPAVSGKVAIVERGNCSFYIKSNNLFSSGAVAIIFFTTETILQPPVGGNYATLPIPVILMRSEDVSGLDNVTVTIAPDFAPIGDPGTSVQIVQLAADTIQVVALGLNFTAAKLAIGDQVLLTANSGDNLTPVFLYRTVEGVFDDNVILLDAALPVSMNVSASSLTILPNIHILGGIDAKTTYASMSGLHVASNVVLESSDVYCSRCALYSLYGEDNAGFGSGVGTLSILGGQVVFTDSSSLSCENIVALGSLEGQQIVLTQSSIYVNNYLQTLWGTSAGTFPGGAIYAVQSSGNFGYLDAAYCVSGNGNGAALSISSQSAFTVYYSTTVSNCDLALVALLSSTINLQNNALLQNAFIGIYANGGSIVRSQGNIIFGTIAYNNYIFDDTSSFDVYYSTFAAFNQLTILSSGTINPFFSVQILAGGSALSMLFNPGAGGGMSYSSVGKRYTFINSDAQFHTITLTQGFFFGYGIPPFSETVLTTSNEVGSVVVLYVVDPNTVVVESALGCIFAKKKRDNFITVSPSVSAPLRFITALRNATTARTSPKAGGIFI